ncbi:autophagy-related protein 11 [Metarhizium robertsii]|uniref:Autophagy-related protein 11 n=2 Tax=Metarhizium robertsii TaxID=568076 RepID=E9EWB3_METRA|nr:Autophagy-related protein 11 [Metarhizium robertsii ARSEF 23]EFZ00535.2 Autophagy-related protein 11 [Metarhizium robertsii ARSEF 23]EXV03028.1 autophagy-related protein 11 [Metarhizium robertsii]
MATQVLIAHTGQRLEVDASQFSAIDELKSWVSRHSSVPLQHMVALTPQGRSVKSASLHAEKELYVYDIRVTHDSSSSTSTSLVPDTPLPPRLSIPNAPNSIDDVQAISSWQGLYQERRAWAIKLAEECARLNSEAMARYDEMDVMIKCLDAAVANLEISVKQIEPKYNELKKWVEPALAEHENLASMWEQHIRLAQKTPISPVMVKFMTQGKVSKGSVTLEDLIEPETARKAAKLAPTARRRFVEKAATLDKLASQMYRGLEELIADFDKIMNRSALGHSTDTAQLLDDIEAVVNQIDSDYRTALGYSGSQRDLAQASKTASNHTERLVPSLKKRAKEMDDLVQYATLARNSIASESVSCMRTITDVTSLHSNVRSQINVLNQSEDDMTTFDYLRLIHQLPYMYASFVVEAIRRREWVDKVKTDSSTLANEMALFQDEESKRRRKWHKMVGSMYGPALDSHVMGLEVNLLGEDLPWPSIMKDDLNTFVQTLQEQEPDEAILKDIEKLVQELNSPTKQQSRRLKAFKNGSVHEAALGRSGLMIRGDDDLLRSLQDDKCKMESKLRTAESRVRRLEDLLHRQSQASRPSNLFQPQNQQPHERRDSSSSVRSNRLDDRRRSSDGADPLLRRITQLENELREEKQKSTRIQKDLSTRATEHDDMKDQIQEANSTKKDLLGNMEALKREFLEERKSLEDEIKTLKARLEENEDEMEHFDASRENEKAAFDGQIQEFESQIEKLAKEKTDEALKAQGQVEYLRKEAQKHLEQLDTSIRQVQEGNEEIAILSKKLREAEELNQSQLDSLHKIHVELCPEEAAPTDLSDLTEMTLSRIANLAAKLQNTESDSAMTKADLEHALTNVKELKAEISETKAKLAKEEDGAVQLREVVSEEKSRVAALENELTIARDALSQLRAKLSAGETGSETLQKKLESAEKKVSQLSEDLASRQSQVGSLEEELHSIKQRMEDMQTKSSDLTAHYDTRDTRTKDLTQRLYTQSERLTRLLERCGYIVARKPGEMTITKVIRSDRATQNPNDSSDPGNSARRSISLSTKSMVDSADLELMYWMNASDAAAESEKYNAFLEKLGSFDIEAFSETIYMRIKEAEHKARKWQREARAYRDRAHTQQKDAHEKIAFKNFKEGDLALFLPTRNQQAGAWAAFNVGFPHYFLRETDAHRLRHREWLVARISRIQERVVDLSKSLQPANDSESINDDENDNPFQLSDGLRWYLIDAQEDKPGAPSTPGMGKSTVASNKVEATADIQSLPMKVRGKNRDSIASIEGINKSLSKSLESRRSSSGSKKALPFPTAGGTALLKSSALASETNSLRAVAPDSPAGMSPVQAGPLSNGQFQASNSENTTSPETQKDTSGNEGGGLQPRESSAQGAAGSSSEVRNVDSLLGP